MAVTTFLPRTVSRWRLTNNIAVHRNRVLGSDNWFGHEDIIAAVVLRPGREFTGDLSLPVQVAIVDGVPLIIPRPRSEAKRATAELVYVQAVGCPGTGAKRYPCITLAVPFGEWPGVRVLARSYRGRGSGSDEWFLLTAPIGFAGALYAYIEPRHRKDAGDIILAPSVLTEGVKNGRRE